MCLFFLGDLLVFVKPGFGKKTFNIPNKWSYNVIYISDASIKVLYINIFIYIKWCIQYNGKDQTLPQTNPIIDDSWLNPLTLVFCFKKKSLANQQQHVQDSKRKIPGLFPLPSNSVIWMFIGIPNPTHVVILLVTIIGKGNNPNIFLIWTPSRFLFRENTPEVQQRVYPWKMMVSFWDGYFFRGYVKLPGSKLAEKTLGGYCFAVGSPPKRIGSPAPGSPKTWVWKVFIGKTFGMVTWDFCSSFLRNKRPGISCLPILSGQIIIFHQPSLWYVRDAIILVFFLK